MSNDTPSIKQFEEYASTRNDGPILTVKPTPAMDDNFIHDMITYHAPTEEELSAIQRVRDAAELFIRAIVYNCPPSADRSTAIRKAREALFTANASIVLRGKV